MFKRVRIAIDSGHSYRRSNRSTCTLASLGSGDAFRVNPTACVQVAGNFCCIEATWVTMSALAIIDYFRAHTRQPLTAQDIG